GKDPSKVDRSAAYAARWAAKNVVAAGLAKRCEVCLAYAIGVAEPVAIYVDSFGTGRAPDDRIAAALGAIVDFRPRAIIDRLGLAAPIYRPTAAYGHFGREPSTQTVGGRELTFFPWERTELAEDLLRKVAE
ncbi:MAG TPA: methionine adenosyltransferase domain-containing protein, partial [Longimicrobiales bacterium]